MSNFKIGEPVYYPAWRKNGEHLREVGTAIFKGYINNYIPVITCDDGDKVIDRNQISTERMDIVHLVKQMNLLLFESEGLLIGDKAYD